MIALILLLFSGIYAEETPPNRLDSTHQKISDSILSFSNSIDSFFGNQRGDDEANGSRLRLFYDTTLRQNEKMNSRLNVRFSLRLPQLQKLLKFSFNKDAKEKNKEPNAKGPPQDKKDSPALVSELQPEDKPSLSQLRDFVDQWSFNFNTGIRVDFPPNLFARARLRRTMVFFEDWEFNPTQELNWFLEEGFGAVFSHDIDRALTKSTILRLTNTFVWNDETDETTSSHGPQIFHQISDTKAMSYSILAQGSNRPKPAINNYTAFITYRQQLYDKWLFGELRTAVEYPREENWNDVYSLFVRVEAVFGSI